MAQHDYVIANGSGSAVRGDLNNALAAIVSNNSGTSEPSPTYAYQFWADTTTGLLKIRNGANREWITLRKLDGTLSIVNADVNASAGIVASKLSFTQSGANATARTIDSKLKELVSVKDFGAVGDGVADDTAAIQAAVDAHRRVFLPVGNYRITSAIVLDDGYSALIGDHRKPTLTIAPGNGPAVKIIATGANLNEFSIVQDLILWCDGQPPYSATPNSTNCGLAVDGSGASVAAAVQRAVVRDCRIIGFSCGINLASHVNTKLQRIFIEHHTAWTTGSYTSANLYVGVNFDCAPFTLGGISPQASVEVDNVVVNLNGSPSAVTSQGFRITGTDPRDIFFTDCESFGGDYGYWINPSSNDYNIDVHIRRPIIDAVKRAGIHVETWNGYGALSIDGGYIVKSADLPGAAIWIDGSRGVTVQNVQVLGMVLNTANDEGIRIKSSSAVTVGGCLVANCRYGISFDASEFCSVAGNLVYAATGAFESAPALSNAIRLFNGAGTNTVSANAVRGASATYKYDEGITVAAGCANNQIVGNSIDASTVTAPYVITDASTCIQSRDSLASSQLILVSRQAQQIYQGNDASYPHLFRDGATPPNNIAGINNAGALIALSDSTLKENVESLNYGIEQINALRPVRFKFISEKERAEESETDCPLRFGFIAQEVEVIAPELVSEIESKLALDQVGIIPILVKAVQELSEQISNLQNPT